MSAELAGAALSRLRYPTDLRKRVVRIVRAHMFDPGKGDALRARKLLARFGDSLAFDLLDHKEADLRGKGDRRGEDELDRLARFRVVLERGAGKPAPPARPRGRPATTSSRSAIRPGPRDRPHAPGRSCTRSSRDPSLNTRE